MTAATTEHLVEVLGPTLEPLGLDLDAVELSRAGRRRVLRVVLDRAGGVDLDQLAEAARAVSSRLDRVDPLGDEPYTLEVTSRGTDRPLTLPRHWQRNVGRLVEVRLADKSRVTGRVREADDDGADLDVDGADRRVAYGDVARARVQAELRRLEG